MVTFSILNALNSQALALIFLKTTARRACHNFSSLFNGYGHFRSLKITRLY